MPEEITIARPSEIRRGLIALKIEREGHIKRIAKRRDHLNRMLRLSVDMYGETEEADDSHTVPGD